MYPCELKISWGFCRLETFSKIDSIKIPSKRLILISIALILLLKMCGSR
jgi:hypothetical protein